MEAKDSPVIQFYAGKNIFITGGTGFLGKCLIEKILRTCPDVGTIYMLCRAKKGKSPSERIEALCNEMLFDNLRAQDPEIFNKKIVPLVGEVMHDKLGLSEEDEQLIMENAHILIHSAATIRFDEHIRDALLMNVGGTVKMVELARKTKNLVSFVHVSTAYANCNLHEIEERYYEMKPTHDPVKLLELCQWMEADAMGAMTDALIGDRPNTYCLTKALGEKYLFEHAMDLPVGIFRPSIIAASWMEPEPGWIDNYNGPTGIIIAIGKGLLRVMEGEKNSLFDVIPIDFCANMLLCIGWYTSIAAKTTEEPIIYHLTSCDKNPFTFFNLGTQLYEHFHFHIVYNDVFRSADILFEQSQMLVNFNKFFNHWIPAYVIDAVSSLKGETFSLRRLYKKIHNGSNILSFFTKNTWHWTYDNCDMLISKMSDYDKKTFNFNVNDIDWLTYYPSYFKGTKKFLLKEDMSPNLYQSARKSQLWWVDFSFVLQTVILPIVIVYVLSSYFSY